jgi:hypothetical protein
MGLRAHAAVWWLLATAPCAAEILGGALIGGRVISWGSELRDHDPERQTSRVLQSGVVYGPGGCAMDADRDGDTDLVLLERGAGGKLGTMVWLEAPHWRRHAIDTGAQFSDCLATTLFGLRGVLIVHRHAQVRFYEAPKGGSGPWQYREIYSIYTPSDQGGLLRLDVDGDGREDIICGNYWIRAPEAAHLPWRLFAINRWWEGERSAMLVWAVESQAGGARNLIAIETEGGRAARFRRPPDPTQFWKEEPLGGPALERPGALVATDLDGDGRDEIYIGDGTRLLAHRRGRTEELMRTDPVVALWRVKDALWVLTTRGAAVWRE